MNRSSFLRSLFVLAASPKVLAKIGRTPRPVIKPGFFNDLQFVIPDYIPELCEKYGAKSCCAVMDEDGPNPYLQILRFHHFEKQLNA